MRSTHGGPHLPPGDDGGQLGWAEAARPRQRGCQVQRGRQRGWAGPKGWLGRVCRQRMAAGRRGDPVRLSPAAAQARVICRPGSAGHACRLWAGWKDLGRPGSSCWCQQTYRALANASLTWQPGEQRCGQSGCLTAVHSQGLSPPAAAEALPALPGLRLRLVACLPLAEHLGAGRQLRAGGLRLVLAGPQSRGQARPAAARGLHLALAAPQEQLPASAPQQPGRHPPRRLRWACQTGQPQGVAVCPAWRPSLRALPLLQWRPLPR